MIRPAAPLVLVAMTLILLASTVAHAQFIETSLPGSAFAGVVPGPDGRFYGLTYDGGTSNMGTLYSVDAGMLSAVVHVNFNGANGKIPYDELTYDAASGKFYGVTSSGGASGVGTVFSYVPGATTVTTLNGTFGSGYFSPQGPLVVTGGFIYGSIRSTTGAVFRMATDGSGFTALHTFAGFDSRPQALTPGADGRLYGVTLAGGLNCNPSFPAETCSTVFRLRPVVPGDGDVQFETLYQIQTVADNGLQRTVTYGSDGLLYFNHHRRIYRLNPSNPAATFQMIWDEPGGSISMSVIEGSDNRLYVASYDNSQSLFAGSIFSLNRDGTDKQVLRTFSFTAGSTAYGPYGRLYRTASGIVYGTTEYTITGSAFGTVFAINGVSNAPPVLSNVAATSPVTEGGTTTLTGTISDPNASDTFTLTVNWGDGLPPQAFNYAAGTTSFSEAHQYPDDNPSGTPSDVYTVALTLADTNGATDTDSAPVTVNNAAPVLSNVSASPSTIVVGQSTSFSGNISDAGALDPHDVTINWGDGSPNTVLNIGAGVNSFNTTHQYNSIATFNIAVTATDDDTASAMAGAVLTVNSPPILSNVAITSPITENGVANLSGNIADANAGDVFSLTVDWGDGSQLQFFGYPAGTTTFNETHQYRDDNPTGTPSDNYTINVTLSDTRENDTESRVITVNNAAPSITNLGANPTTINVGGVTNVSGTVIDVGTLDTHQVVISWGDGSPNTTINLPFGVAGFNSSHQYNASGVFSIRVTATDDDTGSGAASTNITVNGTPQVPPVLSNVVVSSPVVENGTATLTGNIADPNAGDTFVLVVNWGDGSAPQTSNYPSGTTVFSQTHQYLDDNPTATPSDTYTISLTLSDNAGGSDTDSTMVTVNNAVPILSSIAANPSTILVGGTTNLSGTISDVGTLDTHQVVIAWGDGTPVTTLNLAAGIDSFNANHQYVTAGSFNIAVTATDDDTGSANGGANVTVTQPTGGKIAFASLRDGNYEIYSMNPDGSNQTRLTNNSAGDSYPAISSDGNRIAFASTRDGNTEIYLMNADGTGQTRLTTNPQRDIMPAFSPDGMRVVFTSFRNGRADIYVINVDGTNETRLTVSSANDFEPVFSPDGSKIAFTSQRDGYGQVYLMDADGANQTRLTNQVADEYDPSFSPDGTRIAFTSFRDGPTNEIYVMNVDGSNQTRLTNNTVADISSSFSPDGSQIAFVSNRDGQLEVYLMNADGSNQVRLTINVQGNEYPSFGSFPTPPGKIVFGSNRDGGNWEIYSMNSNGTNQTRLTNSPGNDTLPSLSPDGSRIAFTSFRDGNDEIYVMNPDGSGVLRLTNNSAPDAYPAFSPDGNQIAFVSYRDGNHEIYIMNADGTNQTRLTNNDPGADYLPVFSPDGARIAFTAYVNGNIDIYIMNSDGTNRTRLTTHPFDDLSAAFSPDGSRIAFASYRDSDLEIYSMNVNGTDQTRVTNNPGDDAFPSFSPDGRQIAFMSSGDGASSEIYKMNVDGTNRTRLTNNTAQEAWPSWGNVPTTAPGRKIVFDSFRDGNDEIYVMNSNGTNQTRLTDNPAYDGEPGFSPDGNRIVFVSDRANNNEIYVMNADGTGQTRLTTNTANDTQPSFSPDGSRIVFSSNRNGNYEIYVMNADGSNQVRLTNNAASDGTPTFSPDGNRIAFYSDRTGGPGVYLMNSNGANQTRLTNGYEPTFSPSGNRIAFTAFENGVLGVFIIDTDGTNRLRLTSTSSSNIDPAFSPDGSLIVFESARDGVSQLYAMNPDGSNQLRLTNNLGGDYSPSWGGLVLAAPTNLVVTPMSSTQINLTWTDNSVGEDGFQIERCDGNGKCSVFLRIAGTSANVTAFANTGLRPNTFYTYQVRAFSTAGPSPYSNRAKDKTPKP